MISDLYKENQLEAVKFALALASAKGGPPVPLENVLCFPVGNELTCLKVCEIVGIYIGDEWDLKKLLLKRLDELQTPQTQ
jgi:hypothetical protein